MDNQTISPVTHEHFTELHQKIPNFTEVKYDAATGWRHFQLQECLVCAVRYGDTTPLTDQLNACIYFILLFCVIPAYIIIKKRTLAAVKKVEQTKRV